MNDNNPSPWTLPAKTKRNSIKTSIPRDWHIPAAHQNPNEALDVTGQYTQSFLDLREIQITESDAVDITRQTCSEKWSATEVVTAFCHRAAVAHQLVNCLHEVFFEEAIGDAKRLDVFFEENGRPVGPLHGLPVSLKDQFHVKGVETTMGYVGWIGTFEGKKDDPRRGTVESELVRELRNLGAVPYCKTSVPMTLMAGETANNIIGYVPNPKSRLLSAGGSSGGEAALIALKGSPGGFGTDIGGSIRVPASWNHLFGLRPSTGRLPYQGAANSMDGQNTILSVVGPMTTTARSLTLLFKAVLTQQPWCYDPLVLEIPWRDDVERETRALIEQSQAGTSRLAFAVMDDDGMVRPHPPVARAMKLVKMTLTRLGHRILEWKPPSHSIAMKIAAETFSMDGGEDTQYHLSLSGEPRIPQLLTDEGSTRKTAIQIAALNVNKREYQKLYMDYWNSTADQTGTGRPVDGVICPIAPHGAVIPGKYGHLGYTTFLSVLDYTGVAIPVTHADKRVDVPQTGVESLGQKDREIQSQCEYALQQLRVNITYIVDDAETYHGAPVGVQLVGRRLQEEKMLGLAEYISEGLGDSKGVV